MGRFNAPVTQTTDLQSFLAALEEQVGKWSLKEDYDPTGWDRFGDCGASRTSQEDGSNPVFHRYIQTGEEVTGLKAASRDIEVQLTESLVLTDEVISKLAQAGFRFAGVTPPRDPFEELCELFGRQDESFRQEASALISHSAKVEALAQFTGNLPDGAEQLWEELLRK